MRLDIPSGAPRRVTWEAMTSRREPRVNNTLAESTAEEIAGIRKQMVRLGVIE